MASIDERIVSAAFENAKFEQGVAQTMASLAKLDAALAKIGKVNGLHNISDAATKIDLQQPMSALDKLKAKLSFGKTDGFRQMEAEANRVTLAGPLSAIDRLRSRLSFPEAQKGFGDIQKGSAEASAAVASIGNAADRTSGRFSALQIAAGTALGVITGKATLAASAITGNFALGPLKQGFEEYGDTLSSIQTTMAGTGRSTKDVSAALEELNRYSDRTIYSFRDMTANLPKFTNAGVDLETSVKAIQGVANVAAISGASADEAAHSMYNLGQAIGQGYVALRDWRSVELANMGTRQFKEELIKTSEAMGLLKKGTDGQLRSAKGNIVNYKTFTSTLQDQWLTSEALTKTLNRYTDEQTKLGKRAFKSATDIKTLTQLIGIWQESIGSGWSMTFKNLFGNLDEAKSLWGSLNDVVGGFIQKSADARNKALQGWKEMGGRADVIEGVKNIFEGLMSVIKPISEAFRDIFPRQTAESLVELSERFKDFTANLKLSEPAMDNLRRIFAGLFAVVNTGKTIVFGIIEVIADLLGVVGASSGGVVGFAAAIGDLLVAIDNAVSRGGALEGVFTAISTVLEQPITILKALADVLLGVFGLGGDAGDLNGALGNLTKTLQPLGPAADFVAEAWGKLARIFEKVKDTLQPAYEAIAEKLKQITGAIADAFAPENFDKTMTALQTGFLGGILVILRRFKNNLEIELTGGIFDKITDTLGVVTGNLKAMQSNLHAKTLLAIAAAIAALAGSIYVLSKIDPDDLTRSMTAVAVGLGQLVGAMALLTKVGGGLTGIAIIPLLAAGMIELALASVILAGAVKIFSTMDWEELAKGLIGIGGGLAAIALGMKLMGPMSLIQGPALIVIAIGLNILAAAVKQFGDISWEDMAKGILGIGLALTAIAAGLAFLGPSLIITGPGLVLAAFGLSVLAGAVSSFGSLDLKQMAIGIGGIAAALIAIGLAISFIPPTLALQAAGLILLSVGLTGLSAAIGILGNMDISTLVKGIVAMGAALVVLGLGLTAMSATIPGSVALLAAAAAFAVLGPAMGFLGTLEWGTILKALAAMALTLGVLAVAGALVAGPITALSFALGAFGIALGLVTTPIYILAKALQMLGATGTKGISVMVAALTAFVMVLPKIVIDFAKGLVTIIAEVAKLAPKVVVALGEILATVIQFIKDQAPKLAEAVLVLLDAFLKVIVDGAPKIINAGIQLLSYFLGGIAQNIGKIAQTVGTIITKFLDSLTADSPRISKAGVGTLTAFAGGINTGLPQIVAKVAQIITTFIGEVSRHIPRIIAKGAELITKFINGVASKVGDIVGAGVNLILKFLEGVGQAAPKIINKAVEVARKFVNGVASGLVKLVEIGFNAVIDFLNGIAKAIRERGPELRKAGWNVADAIIDGMVAGISELGDKVLNAVGDLMKSLPGKAKKVLGIKSPSRVFQQIGLQTMAGMALGVQRGGRGAEKSTTVTAKRMVATAQAVLSEVPNLLADVTSLEPTITPVLDLSAVKQEAKKMEALTSSSPIAATISADQAAAISTAQQAAAAAQAAQAVEATRPNVEFKFEQNNTSPESISEVEVYRQTNNLLSQAKDALGVL